MSRTNDAVKALCPRTCGDCCCDVHHWGTLYGHDAGEVMGCKHCPAVLDYTEQCTWCKKRLIDHEFDGDWSGPFCKVFLYEGQPKRECKIVHPWDKAGST